MDREALRYDVVVAGGGGAGLAAAVSAAAAGARTALVERYGFLGGMATASMVSAICGLYQTSPGAAPEPLNDGFPTVFARRLAAMPGCDKPVRRGRTYVLPYTPFAFACLADELTASAGGLDVYLHASVADVTRAAGRIESLRVVTWERTLELTAQMVVDASGDAAVAARAGAATHTVPPSARQLPSLVFVLQHVDRDAVAPGPRVALLRTLVAAERGGLLPKGCSNLMIGPSPQPGEVICKLALDGIADEVSDRRDFLTVAEQEGRRRALALTEFLKSLPPFTGAFLSHAATQVGVRESRRVIGRYELTRDDVLSGRRFPDGVARASWPIELWEPGRLGATYEWLEDGQSYDIPLRSLQARDVDNLFVAGRCMSATHEALGSARVIGTCLATGEAVGIAAAREAATSRPA
jgi:glycine/D-amino acid oxidase-like deaminating enzyme